MLAEAQLRKNSRCTYARICTCGLGLLNRFALHIVILMCFASPGIDFIRSLLKKSCWTVFQWSKRQMEMLLEDLRRVAAVIYEHKRIHNIDHGYSYKSKNSTETTTCEYYIASHRVSLFFDPTLDISRSHHSHHRNMGVYRIFTLNSLGQHPKAKEIFLA